MLVQLEHDECYSGGKICGKVTLSPDEAQETDSVHLIVRGQEFSLIYYLDEEKKSQAAAQAHVFYEKSYDCRVDRRQTSSSGDFVIPFALPLPDLLPSTALLHFTTSENFMRVQYKLQVFRTGGGVDSAVTFRTLVNGGAAPPGIPASSGSSSSSSCGGQSSPDALQRDGSSFSHSSHRTTDPIPKNDRLQELFFHHTRSSSDAMSLPIKAPCWNAEQATTHLHVQVAERVNMLRSAFCGLYDYQTTTFRLLTQPSTLHVSPGKPINLVLKDAKNFLRTWIDRRTTFVLVGKVTQTIQWYTSRRFVAYPIHNSWDLPEISFEVDPLTEEEKSAGIANEHTLLDQAVTFPEQATETYDGYMLSIKSELMLGLRFVDLSGKKLAAGATPKMPLQVRGCGGLSLITKEAVV